MDLTRRVNQAPACTCGCGGEQGHILSTDRWDSRQVCTSLSTNGEGVFVQCRYAKGHSELVPHSDGERVWGGLSG